MLGVDPGLVGTGWGLVEPAAGGGSAAAVIATGVITTSADTPLPARIREIYEGVIDVLAKHEPALLVLEDLYTEYKFPRTALLMAHARGAICLAAAQRDVGSALHQRFAHSLEIRRGVLPIRVQGSDDLSALA